MKPRNWFTLTPLWLWLSMPSAQAGMFPLPDGDGAPAADWSVPGDGKTPSTLDLLHASRLQLNTPSHLGASSSTGTASHGIDIAIPPVGRLRPNLGLQYGSQTPRDREAPDGWRIAGVSEIRRPLHSAYGPGQWLLDGALLEPDGSSFRLVSTTSSNATATYDASTDTWEVTWESGLVRRYEACDLGASGADGTGVWRVFEERDTSGNQVEYGYFGDSRLHTVQWGANVLTGEGHLAEVRFRYTPRAHPLTDGRSGVVEQYDQVIDTVDVSMRSHDSQPWDLVREVVLHLDDTDGHIMLTGYDITGHDGAATQTLVGERYSYSEARGRTEAIYSALGTSGGVTRSDASRTYHQAFSDQETVVEMTLLDWNGDGLLDQVEGTDTGWSVRLQELAYSGAWAWGSTPSWGSPIPVSAPPVHVQETVTEQWTNGAFSAGLVGWQPRQLFGRTQLVHLDDDGWLDLVISDDTTNWEVWYGTGDDHFDGPYIEPAPANWSSVAYAADTDMFPGETCAKLSGLLDADHDGWLDWFDPFSNDVFVHTGVRGGGWDTSANLHGSLGPVGAPCWTEVDRQMAPDPVWSVFSSSITYVEQTMERASFYDLNADGLLDRVDASVTPWQVQLGARNGGLDPATSWGAPMPYTSVVREAYPAVTVPHPTGGPTIRFPGIDGALLRGLFDVDGDGDLDYADPGAGIWYANTRDGFAPVANTLPGWWPITLSDDHPYSGGTSYPGGIATTTTMSETTQRMLDLDGDRVPDQVTTTDGTVGYTHDRPNLLIEVQTSPGATTDFLYERSSRAYPSGVGMATPRSAPGSLLRELTTTDPIAGDTATSELSYRYPTTIDGVFFGYGEHTVDNYLDGLWTDRTWNLYQHGFGLPPMLDASLQYIDGNLGFAPSLVRGSPFPKLAHYEQNTWADVGPFHRLRDDTRTIEYGEDTIATRHFVVDYRYDAEGRLVGVEHDGGGDPTQRQESMVHYASGTHPVTGESLVVPASIKRLGFDPITGVDRALSHERYRYDGATSHTTPPTSGILTAIDKDAGWTDGGELLGASQLTTTFARGPYGELDGTTDVATGNSQSFTYDLRGGIPRTTTDALGHTRTRTYDARGRLVQEVDANGIGVLTAHDALGRPTETSVIDRWGVALPTSRTHYDDVPYAISGMPQGSRVETIDATGGIETTEHHLLDGSGQQLQRWRQSPLGDWLVSETDYDLLGRTRTDTHNMRTSAAPHLAAVTAPDFGRRWHDPFGRVREQIEDAGAGFTSSTARYPDPGVEVHTDAGGITTRLTRDTHGRIVSTEQLLGDGVWAVTATYEWDGLDQLVRYTDANGNVYSYSFDAAGRLRESDGPDIGTTNFSYVGQRLVSRVDAAGGQGSWTYDTAGRMTSQTLSDPLSASGVEVTTFTYDGDLLGYRDGHSNGFVSNSITYDDFGRTAEAIQHYTDGTLLSEATIHDHHGRIVERWTPGGSGVISDFQHGWKVRDHVDGMPLGYTYGDDGELTEVLSALGMYTLTYTSPTRADSVSVQLGGRTWQVDQTWRDDGYLLSTRFSAPYAVMPEEHYVYDAVGQLKRVEELGLTIESFDYDPAGNMTQLVEPTGAMWTYTPAGTGTAVGNQVAERSDGSRTERFGFDAAGRRSSFDDGSTLETYLYDGLGRLRAIVLGAAVTEVIERNGDGEIVATIDGGVTTYQFGSYRLDGASGDVSEQLTAHLAMGNGQRQWQLMGTDGHVRATIDDTGTEIGARGLGAYGFDRWSSGTTWDQAAYHGMPSSGAKMLAAGPRHLVAGDGTWLQPEPLLYTGALGDLAKPRQFAALRYAANAPTAFHDRSGFEPDAVAGCSYRGDCPPPPPAPEIKPLKWYEGWDVWNWNPSAWFSPDGAPLDVSQSLPDLPDLPDSVTVKVDAGPNATVGSDGSLTAKSPKVGPARVSAKFNGDQTHHVGIEAVGSRVRVNQDGQVLVEPGIEVGVGDGLSVGGRIENLNLGEEHQRNKAWAKAGPVKVEVTASPDETRRGFNNPILNPAGWFGQALGDRIGRDLPK